MKRNRITMGLMALFISIAGAFAFTDKQADVKGKPVFEVGWFQLTNTAHPELASSYTYVGTTMPCSGDESLCAIKGTRNEEEEILIPSQDDVDAASVASDEFTHPVTNQVAFEE